MAAPAEWLATSSFSPHGFCLSWQPGLLELHALSDAVTSVCYMAVGFLIFQFGRRRPDMGPKALFNALAVVFVLCGFVHASDIVVLWLPLYVEQGLLKAVTAAGSLPVLIILIRLLPQAATLPSPAQMAEVNRSLSEEVALGHEREQQLRKLSMAVEQNPAMVLITDTRGVIEYVNTAFSRISGYPAAEVLGQTPALFRSGTTAVEVYRAMWFSLNRGEEWRGELEDRRKDGAAMWISLTISPVRAANGVVTHFVAISQDISERKAAERQMAEARFQAETASRAKTEILANMSHEFRTPLNAIIGFSETIMTGVFGPLNNDKQLEYLRDINASGVHLLALINDVLDVAAIEARHMDLHESWVDLGALVTACVRLVDLRAVKGRVRINVTADTIPAIRADERRIKQVLLNLLSNAVKFTNEGGTVVIAATRTPDGGLELAIADSGIGMSPAELVKAKEPFGQVDSSLRRRYQGTGLGLPLSIGLIEEHGGQVLIDSVPGVGTTVKIRLPAERVLEASALPCPPG